MLLMMMMLLWLILLLVLLFIRLLVLDSPAVHHHRGASRGLCSGPSSTLEMHPATKKCPEHGGAHGVRLFMFCCCASCAFKRMTPMLHLLCSGSRCNMHDIVVTRSSCTAHL
jgi:hypothetical protein